VVDGVAGCREHGSKISEEVVKILGKEKLIDLLINLGKSTSALGRVCSVESAMEEAGNGSIGKD